MIDSFEEDCCIFCRMSVNLSLFVFFFPWLRWGDGFREEGLEIKCHFYRILIKGISFQHDIVVYVDLGHLAGVASVRFPQCIVTLCHLSVLWSLEGRRKLLQKATFEGRGVVSISLRG